MLGHTMLALVQTEHKHYSGQIPGSDGVPLGSQHVSSCSNRARTS